MITSVDIAAALQQVAARVQSSADELCRADGELGDGDLGITVANGFAEAAKAELPADVGLALLEVAKAFQRVSSSSYGTLVATGFMSAAKVLKGSEQLDPAQIPALVAGACDAMMARGKGNLGDKTVLDSLDAMAAALAGVAPAEMAATAARSAAATVETFRTRPNLLGRARMFGDRSVGLVDPGQLALQRIVEGLLPAA